MAQLNDFVMNLPHQYYPAIGEFIFRCGQLENQLHEILWRAIDINNKQGRVLTIGTDAKVVRGMLSTVTSDESKGFWIPISEKTLRQTINSLVKNSKEFTKLRNKIAHGTWQSPVGGKAHDVRLLFMKEQDEKYYAKFDPGLDDAYIHRQCKQLKALNLKAKTLLLSLHSFRGMNPRHLHSAKNVS